MIGMIARCDGGGLAAQTFEFWRNVRPARTVVALAPVARLPLRRDLYRDIEPGQLIRFSKIIDVARQASWLVEPGSVVYSAETVYSAEVFARAEAVGAHVYVHANPELFTPNDGGSGTIWAPTSWEIDRIPGAIEVPFPIATDRLPYRRRTNVEVLFHLGAPAFHDRAGTDIVLAAAPYLPDGIPLLVRAEPPRGWLPADRGAKVEWLGQVRDYTSAIPEEADLLLAPRRYGGLTLPVQEASARGIPSVMTDVEPQRGWFPKALLAGPCHVVADVQMRGGSFPVHGIDPEVYAATVRALIGSPALTADMSDAVYAWALARSWAMLLPEYRDRLSQ